MSTRQLTRRQFRQGPALEHLGRNQKDHEALLDPRAEQEDVQGAEAAQALETRERECLVVFASLGT